MVVTRWSWFWLVCTAPSGLGYAAEQAGMDFVGLAQAYRLFDDPGHRAEVSSTARASELERPAYLTRFVDTGKERQSDIVPGV
ncbi:hypothetical protein [Plantactinospora sp. KLBMP9567]|uniref:hypothetical protein n=1 Tax=Plantactinospora sp. KLBMP9567 TaxID=3085900 RepID=UPI0029812B9B|nr:hypothetical protein [Plantactinospora sp. KLBMP9567]MDW5328330.1 hypothetical protein [Plantactinospora sp. KLBMP9567]